jgi:hypothetical protein
MPARIISRLLVLGLLLLGCAYGIACYHPHWHHW